MKIRKNANFKLSHAFHYFEYDSCWFFRRWKSDILWILWQYFLYVHVHLKILGRGNQPQGWEIPYPPHPLNESLYNSTHSFCFFHRLSIAVSFLASGWEKAPRTSTPSLRRLASLTPSWSLMKQRDSLDQELQWRRFLIIIIIIIQSCMNIME